MSYNGQSSESRFEYFEKEIFPSYIENGIYFSPLLARFPPFFDRESIMNDVESVYQNMMMLKYAKTSAFKPNDAKPNVDK